MIRTSFRLSCVHDDVIKWKHFPRYWPFVRGIHRWPMNFTQKSKWRGALMFPFICTLINGWVNNRDVGDFRRHCAHYDVTVMWKLNQHHERCGIVDKLLICGFYYLLSLSLLVLPPWLGDWVIIFIVVAFITAAGVVATGIAVSVVEAGIVLMSINAHPWLTSRPVR